MTDLFAALADTGNRNRVFDTAPVLPEEAKTWLGRLTLLHGVPFPYLVPDERMLPAESLRFFYVDPQWLAALIGGALSLGPREDVVTLLNKVMAGSYAKALIEEARAVRRRELQAVRSRQQGSSAGADAAAPTTSPADPADAGRDPPSIDGLLKFSGFLLRSDIVAGWRGLTVSAYGKDREALLTLRLERLARDTLFGLFEGYLCGLEIVQPLEGLHFDPQEQKAEVIDRNRVLDVKRCRAKAAPNTSFANSAEFADALLARPYRYQFRIGAQQ